MDLLQLEDRVVHALESTDESELKIIGYGEVTLVLRLRTADGDFACKRLPVLATAADLAAYEAVLNEYVERLCAEGVHVAPTELWSTSHPDGGIVGYLIQETLPAEGLLNSWLKTATETEANKVFDQLLDAVIRVARPTLGFDAQSSNWVWHDGKLTYIDVTTPFMRDGDAKERLDFRPFFTSLPWALQDAVRVGMGKDIFDKFYSPHGVMLDMLGNLHKEKLQHLIGGFMARANERLAEPLTADEIDAYYAEDAKLWTLIQRLRKADQWWQRTVRRRPYPFLLPRAIER